MKKVFRFFAIAAIAFGMTTMVACGSDDDSSSDTGDPILLEENFDNGIPSGWTSIDVDGDGIEWDLCSNYFSGTFGYNNTDCLASPSYTNNLGALETDNYIVTPTIHIPGAGGYNLTFNVANFQNEYPDKFSVLVGTLENGSFNTLETLFDGRVSVGVYEGDDMATQTYNLDAYKGQDICIAFRHHDSDAYFILVDNVKISNEATKLADAHTVVKDGAKIVK